MRTDCSELSAIRWEQTTVYTYNNGKQLLTVIWSLAIAYAGKRFWPDVTDYQNPKGFFDVIVLRSSRWRSCLLGDERLGYNKGLDKEYNKVYIVIREA